MDRYTHSYHGEQSAALETLPDISPSDRKKNQTTGTDDANPSPENLARATCRKSVGRMRLIETLVY